jgi:hypothetical protein
VELVNRLILGEPETTIGLKYESTLDGRQAAVHERSSHAGSGDPKKAAERAAAGVLTSASTTVASSKTNPDAAVIPSTKPGQAVVSKVASAVSAIENAVTKVTNKNNPGDKDEVHVSEEELGVTTPRSTK